MAKKYLVTLTEDERAALLAFTKQGTVSARTLTRAHILLQADAQATDDDIAKALQSGTATSSGPASAWSKRAWRQPSTNAPALGGAASGKVNRKRGLSRGPVVHLLTSGRAGRCHYWPTNW